MEKQKKVRIRFVILLTFVGMIIVSMTDIASAEPGKLVHNTWNPPGVMLGITYDNIGLKNDVKLCQPVPTDDTSKGVRWDWCNVDFTYSLQQFDKESFQYFPLNDLPSGGNSKRISKSEMTIAIVTLLVNDSAGGYVQFDWYKKEASGDRLMVKSQKLSVPACGGYPHIGDECGIYGSLEEFGYIGHFSGEIVEGGYYYVIIDTKWGQSRIDFVVMPVPGGAPGNGVRTVVTPIPKATSVSKALVVVPVVGTTPSNSFSYNTGKYVGVEAERFLSGIFHGFWNEIFG